jgi:hypothetical protein
LVWAPGNFRQPWTACRQTIPPTGKIGLGTRGSSRSLDQPLPSGAGSKIERHDGVIRPNHARSREAAPGRIQVVTPNLRRSPPATGLGPLRKEARHPSRNPPRDPPWVREGVRAICSQRSIADLRPALSRSEPVKPHRLGPSYLGDGPRRGRLQRQLTGQINVRGVLARGSCLGHRGTARCSFGDIGNRRVLGDGFLPSPGIEKTMVGTLSRHGALVHLGG